MNIKKKIKHVFKKRNLSQEQVERIMREHDERALKGALSGKSYSKEEFGKIWELANFSDDEIFGIKWEEKDKVVIKNKLSNLSLKLRDSKSPALIAFDFEFGPENIVDGFIALTKSEHYDSLICSFGFIDKKANNLTGWLIEKYGEPAKIRDETVEEFYYDWTVGDILISVDIVKNSKLGDVSFKKWPDYTKWIREEFIKKQNNPCPCGVKDKNGQPVKYKDCHGR